MTAAQKVRARFGPSSPFYRFRVKAGTARRDAIGRLESLGVSLTEIPAQRARPLLSRFVREFVDPAKGPEVEAALTLAAGEERPFDFDPWLHREAPHRRDGQGCVEWLAGGANKAHCFRFERNAYLPALRIDLATIESAWAASWPGVFVSFEAMRAVVVTPDYEEVRSEVRAGRATPYR